MIPVDNVIAKVRTTAISLRKHFFIKIPPLYILDFIEQIKNLILKTLHWYHAP